VYAKNINKTNIHLSWTGLSNWLWYFNCQPSTFNL